MMFRNLMRVCCYAPSPAQPGGSILRRPMRHKRFKNVRLPNNPQALCFSQLQDQTHIRIIGDGEGQQGYIEECKCDDAQLPVLPVLLLLSPIPMRFGCVDRSTLFIADEVGSMKVSTWSSKGTDVHDFTPDSSTRHWTCLPEDEQSRVAGKGDNRRDTCFVCFMERDAALAYAYAVVAVWKDVCVVGISRSDHVNKSILKSFVHSLGPLMNNDERTWLRALIAAKAIVMEIAGAECTCTWQHTVQELGNEKSHFFMTKHCGSHGQSQCSYYAGSPSSEDMGGSRCQVLLQKLLGFASNEMDLNQIIETSASS